MSAKVNSAAILGLLSVAIGVASLLLMPSQIDGYRLLTLPEVRSPAFFPALISSLLIAIGILLTWFGLAGRVPAGPEQDWPEKPTNVLATLAIILGYTGLIFVVGFYLASIAMVAVLAPLLGYRNGIAIVFTAAGIALLIYVLFERSLNVFLPGSAGF